jgi:hypothetical protein
MPITSYLNEKLQERISKIPELSDELIKDAINMSNIGINSDKEYNNFSLILKQSVFLSKSLSEKKLSLNDIIRFASIIYTNIESYPINTNSNFYKASINALNKMNIPIKKTAYPQGSSNLDTESPHNLQKWMQAMRDIYAMAQTSLIDTSKAFDIITNKWNKMERQDFKHWMSFYEENAHNKYKTAQASDKIAVGQEKYYSAGPGAMIPMDHLKARLPSGPNMHQFERGDIDEQLAKKQEELAQKEIVNKKIRSIISRLNAAERLATDPAVQKDLQQCLDIGVPKWLEELQRVKRLVQLAPMRSASSPILEDLIIKQSNILRKKGYPKAANEMEKLAQQPQAQPNAAGPNTSPGNTGADDDKAINELIEGMNTEQDSGDVLDIKDTEDDPLASITIIAQAIPENQDIPTAVQEKSTQRVGPEINVSEDDPMEEEAAAARTVVDPRTDDLFEAALSNVSVRDVIVRLETIANIFRTREIPRQLALIDLMLDRLNLSAFFPSLAEASSKTLESNQYALSRIEDIISKLRGSVDTPKEHELDLVGRGTPSRPAPENVNPEKMRANLSKQDELDKARKERRQAEEDAKATETLNQSAPEITNVPEELAQPATITPQPARPVR